MAQFRKGKKRNHVLLLLEAESNTTQETDSHFLACMQHACTYVHVWIHTCTQGGRETQGGRAAESEGEHGEKGQESQGVLKIKPRKTPVV